MSRAGRLGFVPARFGPDVIGGAEAVVREAAIGLADRGWEVEILTTQAKDHYAWDNVYPSGVSHTDGLVVRRFPAVVSTSQADRHRLGAAILAGEPLTISEQQRWVNDDMRVPEIYHHLLNHAHEYRALFFAPYMFWTSYAGAQISPERTILIPCLHDEPFAYLDIYKTVFSGVRGMWFLSEPERSVAEKIFDLPARASVVGAGINPPSSYDPEGFVERYGLRKPFVLYAGRREGGKGWDYFLETFSRISPQITPRPALVTIGAGKVETPKGMEDWVIDLGFLPEEERNNAFAAAAASIQPSPYESFSRTIMESWLAGTLVIGNGASEVVRWHCERSGAGLVYEDDFELAHCLAFATQLPDQASALASAGRQYVTENYSWPKVLDSMEATIEEWT